MVHRFSRRPCQRLHPGHQASCRVHSDTLSGFQRGASAALRAQAYVVTQPALPERRASPYFIPCIAGILSTVKLYDLSLPTRALPMLPTSGLLQMLQQEGANKKLIT